jgi:hypothetical protein
MTQGCFDKQLTMGCQVSYAVRLKYSLFRVYAQRMLITDVSGQHTGPIFKGHDPRPLKTAPIHRPETSTIEQHAPHNNPDQRSSPAAVNYAHHRAKLHANLFSCAH